MSERFVQLGDTSIKDTFTGEKYYAPCEDGLLDLLNEQQATIEQLKSELNDCEKFRYEVFKRIGELEDE